MTYQLLYNRPDLMHAMDEQIDTAFVCSSQTRSDADKLFSYITTMTDSPAVKQERV